jgi:(p)ppGpp synthase/HD superfamily hydrolase
MEGEFLVDLRIDLSNVRGVLASVANAVSHAEANIESIQMQDIDAITSRVSLLVAVTGRIQLSRVLRRLHALPAVAKIERV